MQNTVLKSIKICEHLKIVDLSYLYDYYLYISIQNLVISEYAEGIQNDLRVPLIDFWNITFLDSGCYGKPKIMNHVFPNFHNSMITIYKSASKTQS